MTTRTNYNNFSNCVIIILFLMFVRSECLKTRTNFKSETELNNTKQPFNSIEKVMSSNDLFPETISFTKVAKVPKDQLCNNINCRSPFGKCADLNTCECGELYFDVPFLLKNHNLFCRYRQKSQAVEFILELMFLSGLGHLYSERSALGLMKLSFTIITIILIHFIKTHIPSETEQDDDRNHTAEISDKNKILKYLPNAILFIFFSVQIFDLFLICRNSYSDGYGIPLKKFDLNQN